jgi:hypothetical protein
VAAFRREALAAAQLDLSGSVGTPEDSESVAGAALPAIAARKQMDAKRRPKALPAAAQGLVAEAGRKRASELGAAGGGGGGGIASSPQRQRRAVDPAVLSWRAGDLKAVFATEVAGWAQRAPPLPSLCAVPAAAPLSAAGWAVVGATAGEPWSLCHRPCARGCGSGGGASCLGELLLGCPQRIDEQSLYRDLCRNMALPPQPLDHPVLLDATASAVSPAQLGVLRVVSAAGPSPDVLTALFRQLFARSGFRLNAVDTGEGDGGPAVEITHVGQGTSIADVAELCDFALAYRAAAGGDAERAQLGAQAFRPKGVRRLFVKESARLADGAPVEVGRLVQRTEELLREGCMDCPHGRPAFVRVSREVEGQLPAAQE